MSSYEQAWGGATVSITYPDKVTYQTEFDVSFTVDASTMGTFDAIAFLSTLGMSQTVDLSIATWSYTFVSDDPAWNFSYTGTLGDEVSPWHVTDTQYVVEFADPVTSPYTWVWHDYNDRVTWSLNDMIIEGDTTFTLRLDDLGIVAGPIEPAFIVLDPPVQAVMEVNQAPLANSDLVIVAEDGGATQIDSAALLLNDIDADAGDTLTLVGVGASESGATVALVDGQVTYDAGNLFQALAEGEVGHDSFAYTIADGAGATASGVVDVNIVGSNDAPVAVADFAQVVANGPAAGGNVLSNDSDVDQGTVLAVAAPGDYNGTYGSLWLAADGTFAYKLDADSAQVQSLGRSEQRVEHFVYAATDGLVATEASLDVFVSGANDAPVVAAPLADRKVSTRDAFSLQLPADSFVDIDAGDAIDYTATLSDGSPLPAWLQFDAETLTFSGVAPKTKTQLEILVTATDRVAATGSTEGSLSASDVFVLSVTSGKAGMGASGRVEKRDAASVTESLAELASADTTASGFPADAAMPAWFVASDTHFPDMWGILPEAHSGDRWEALHPALAAHMVQAAEFSYVAEAAPLTSVNPFASHHWEPQGNSSAWAATARFESF
jgi:VCBS repeat-containing protein